VHGRSQSACGHPGRSLAIWLAETAAFLSGAMERKPFPFSPWPAAEA